MPLFAFRFAPEYRAAAALFGVTRSTSGVSVTAERLEARFGPWVITTPIGNVTDWKRTGPFTRPKTIGPAHLSLRDRGLTFATNPHEGVCVSFGEPVSAMDPLGFLKHPGLTVTVENPEALEEALSAAKAGGLQPDEPCGDTGRSPWSVLTTWMTWPTGALMAAARYLRARGDIECSFERRGPHPDPEVAADGAGIQTVHDGVGPLFRRIYRVRITGADRTPEEVITSLVEDFNNAAPTEIMEFEPQPDHETADPVGSDVLIRMPGPWRVGVRLVERTPTSLRLVTLDGRMEAGHIDFSLQRADEASGEDTMVFEIDSLARSKSLVYRAIYDWIPIAREIQLHMWTHYCRRIAVMAGGSLAGRPEVFTVRYAA